MNNNNNKKKHDNIHVKLEMNSFNIDISLIEELIKLLTDNIRKYKVQEL